MSWSVVLLFSLHEISYGVSVVGFSIQGVGNLVVGHTLVVAAEGNLVEVGFGIVVVVVVAVVGDSLVEGSLVGVEFGIVVVAVEAFVGSSP